MIGDAIFDRVARSRAMSTKVILLVSALGGAFSFILFGATFVSHRHNFVYSNHSHVQVVCGNTPPMKAYWSAERTVKFWEDHLVGAHVAVGLQLCSGMWYIPFSALISHQIRKVPGIHPIVARTQLAACSAGIFTWMMGAMVLATTTYRLDRNPEITQVMTDMWWITTMMPWPTFMIQNFAWGYAILKDPRPDRPVPRPIAIINIIAPCIFVLPSAMHTVKTGAFAWHGGVSFWLLGLSFGVQLFTDSAVMVKVALAEVKEMEGGGDVEQGFVEDRKTPTQHSSDKSLSV